MNRARSISISNLYIVQLQDSSKSLPAIVCDQSITQDAICHEQELRWGRAWLQMTVTLANFHQLTRGTQSTPFAISKLK
jgi:hypothetical protein